MQHYKAGLRLLVFLLCKNPLFYLHRHKAQLNSLQLPHRFAEKIIGAH
jgi:hypothetical protein